MTKSTLQIANDIVEACPGTGRMTSAHKLLLAGMISEELSKQRQHTEFYQKRCDALQQAQHHMRDPERKMVCDILANGMTYEKPVQNTRHGGT